MRFWYDEEGLNVDFYFSSVLHIASTTRTIFYETLQPSYISMLIRNIFFKLFHQRNQVIHPS